MIHKIINYALAAGLGALGHKYAPTFPTAPAPAPAEHAEMSIFSPDSNGDDVTVWDCSETRLKRAVTASKPTLIVRVGKGGKVSAAAEKAFCIEMGVPFKHYAEMPQKASAINAKYRVLWHVVDNPNP
jgi:hypothetical protein